MQGGYVLVLCVSVIVISVTLERLVATYATRFEM